ncbi:SAVED domain-containing protein [Mucilaginibacter sp. KACC 22773]|jgi:hypothetical protein|uniref:Hachiman antiphage defense system protein HamA n=1 Tax=Mucilaginibacter sp. KACC 22773 TaxID=3025671 RepID=UPI002365B004|nr:Hachiman antiphage defense system protein HamA [Mucilaginibacter sp. KACC 22773]WDF78974.1 SAVED domain-containing protein [Mucilaginibacter sp. KACC 22773]
MPTPQDILIGKHPAKGNFFAEWLDFLDEAVPAADPNKKHRKLSEIAGKRGIAIKGIAQYLLDHHVDPKKLARAKKRKEEILKKYKLKSFEEYLDTQTYFPKAKNTRNGNTAEVILSNYLQVTSGLSLLAFKLTYNPNVDQAIKGDDCLLFDVKDLTRKVIVGEAKFRGRSPDNKAIKEMIKNLEGAKKLPISLPFISQHFTAIGDEEMAAQIDDLLYELTTGKVNVVNVGLIISTKSANRGQDAGQQLDHYLKTNNPQLVALSLGIDDPDEIVDKTFDEAYKFLKASVK